ncbi:hypothetical protein T12_6444 [Trichinella patagoniensis]|uniref:Uncharacterized protein n=1 Tax=Trichinella patagoniensis TaxID=990121 RepID=A0A0V0Z1Q4_9BILA|nr:hypothetical protein T12_6444 [Trichinella patagoniensis]
MVRMNRAPDGATNGERGRIDGLEWVRPPEVLTMVSNVETWFEHMELYFACRPYSSGETSSPCPVSY